jgi:hypothetical protein
VAGDFVPQFETIQFGGELAIHERRLVRHAASARRGRSQQKNEQQQDGRDARADQLFVHERPRKMPPSYGSDGRQNGHGCALSRARGPRSRNNEKEPRSARSLWKA